MDTKPITIEEAITRKQGSLPPEVFDVINKLIVENYSVPSQKATVDQSDIVDELVYRLNLPRQEIFDRGYLDVEALYGKAGWSVDYHKPSYDESFQAFFVFSRK